MAFARQSGLRSGEVAEQAGVNIQTLRYYERRGLITEPDRSIGGHRTYPPDTVALIAVIKSRPTPRIHPRRNRRPTRSQPPPHSGP